MTERAYRDLEQAGYSRSTLRTLDLVLAKAFAAQTGRTLGAHRPREATRCDRCGPWSRLGASSITSRVIGSIRCGGCCSPPACGVANCAG